MPLLLPSKLFPWMIQHGIFPEISTDLVANYWRHLVAVGSPLRHMSPNKDHIPMYVWGDGAQYTESGESMMVFSCGIVIDPKRTNIFPLFLCREVTRHKEYKLTVNVNFFFLMKGMDIVQNWSVKLHWSSKYILWHVRCGWRHSLLVMQPCLPSWTQPLGSMSPQPAARDLMSSWPYILGIKSWIAHS